MSSEHGGGTYQQLPSGEILTPDGKLRTSSMPAAAAALATMGWGDVQVLTVLHATSGSLQTIPCRAAVNMIVSPAEMVQLLMAERDRGGRTPWSLADAELFERHVGELRAMLIPAIDHAPSRGAMRAA